MKTTPKGIFNGIAQKFDKNIYGSTKGQLRHQLLLHFLTPYIQSKEKLTVLDAGAGTGVMSAIFADAGHAVTLVDGSQDILDIAQQQLNHYSNCTFVCADIAELPVTQRYDLIICHAVLEWTDAPYTVIQHLLKLLKPTGFMSISFFNQDAKLFSNALYGNFDYIEKGMTLRNTVRLNPLYPLKPTDVLSEVANMNVNVVHQAGIRCFHDYMLDRTMQETKYADLLSLELAYATKMPFMLLGKYYHLIIQKCE